MFIFNLFQRMEKRNSTEWKISGSLVDSTEIDEEETLCSSQNQALNIFVASRFEKFTDANDTCNKISRSGTNLTEIKSMEQFRLWHKAGNNNKVCSH